MPPTHFEHKTPGVKKKKKWSCRDRETENLQMCSVMFQGENVTSKKNKKPQSWTHETHADEEVGVLQNRSLWWRCGCVSSNIPFI